MPIHHVPRFPRGFRGTSRNCGLKEVAEDLALFASEVPAAAAAVFTQNHFPGAPVVVGRELIRAGRLQAVVVNSKVSNVATGGEGVLRARRMGEAAARELGISPELVLMSSTGVIGVPLPIEKVEEGIRGMAEGLGPDPLAAARGMMTTDTHPKALSLGVGDATVTVVAKGSGMIQPDMATMLAYLFTDAAVDAPTLDRLLREVVDETFNMLSVDGDTSTSDSCAILANGLAGPVEEEAFRGGLLELCTGMAEVLARDGEGATKLLRVVVEGAQSREDARTVARALVNSPLIKTMAYGADPNVGRILMAVGKCRSVRVVPERVHAWVQEALVVEDGLRASFRDEDVRRLLEGDPVEIRVGLGLGDGAAVAFGCDLSPGYIEENAAYYSS